MERIKEENMIRHKVAFTYDQESKNLHLHAN
ncbi:uncharacterized protein G2W53_030691 [Senna tora]|uniref:Uncharacterized protein n=1 Tax=Senna tora TaxID=362788 RepID=A0A834T9I4_9FABA|nr:uncharacterized protein G2W53_030691 [Senna tora]